MFVVWIPLLAVYVFPGTQCLVLMIMWMPSDTHPSYNDDGQYTAPVMLFSFIIGAQLRK